MKIKSTYILAFIILICSISILYWSYENYQSNKIAITLKEVSTKEEKNIEISEELYNPPANKDDSSYQYIDEKFYHISLNEAIKENNETVGWINIPNTKVDYPIVQTANNDYYLDHNFDKTKSNSGWIYLDFRNDLENLNRNTIIYGHNRKDKSMFGSLKDMLNEDYFTNKDNHLIKLVSKTQNTIWQIFSVYTISKEYYYLTTNFLNNESYLKYLNTIQGRSKINFKTSVNENDKVLTLSTCKDNLGHRIVIHAKLLKKETF